MELDIKLMQTKPMEAEAVEVRFDDWDYAKAITDWAHGRLHNGTNGTYIEVQQLVDEMKLMWVRARSGDWIVRSGHRMADIQVLDQDEYEEQFETRARILNVTSDIIDRFNEGVIRVSERILTPPVQEILPTSIQDALDKLGAEEVDASSIARASYDEEED
jgi:hypothetical protein